MGYSVFICPIKRTPDLIVHVMNKNKYSSLYEIRSSSIISLIDVDVLLYGFRGKTKQHFINVVLVFRTLRSGHRIYS